MMSKLTIFLLVLLTWLQYSLWFGKNGLREYNSLHKIIMKQQKINTEFRARNNQFFNETNDLNKNQEAIEELARNELNMAKSDETFFHLIPDISENVKHSKKK